MSSSIFVAVFMLQTPMSPFSPSKLDDNEKNKPMKQLIGQFFIEPKWYVNLVKLSDLLTYIITLKANK